MGNLACIISYINMYVHITCICKDLVEYSTHIYTIYIPVHYTHKYL